MGVEKPIAATVDQRRIDAARARVKRSVEYLDTIAADSPYDKFGTQRTDLRQALDLLNPEVSDETVPANRHPLPLAQK